ncbi:AAA family ATPase [Micromonospora sp. NPDC049559]|uniref:helix-turn-helix transcriptional regulator n=1 Tax=Micromonospora sp. NPDC049559 TaxID=3155923 RepID=UPI0034173F71
MTAITRRGHEAPRALAARALAARAAGRAMIAPVEVRPVSSVFVGRGPELEALGRAVELADGGAPQAVLLRGEAGVGKTRLIEELLRTLEARSATTAAGGCVEIGGEGLPFAPFSAVLRALWQQLPEEVRAASAGHEELLARILPDLGPSGPIGQGDDDSARLFELTARILERLASSRLVVLVIEDLHWADPSTRHLLGYLFRTRRNGRLLIIASYRSDDIHRRHPLRPLLAEADRLRSVQRIEIRRFDRVEVLKQLTGILGVPPNPALLNEIFERSDGNPFFVEELARSYVDHARVRLDDLRDLLLVRLDALPDSSQQIIRIAAEGGVAVTYPLLKAVVGLPEEELIEALRVAVLAHILIPAADESGYRFRHSLVREAVSGSLLPGERSLINQKYAEALEADPSLVRDEELATRLAHHWYNAHDDVKALRMSVSASVEARNRYAYAEQLRLLERAMELWGRVPESERGALRPLSHSETYPLRGHGADGAARYIDLLAAATVAGRQSGECDRALNLARQALELLAPDGDRLYRAWFWLQRAALVQELNRGDGWQELRNAHDLVRGLPPSAVHADVLIQLASWGAKHRPGPESQLAAERAVDYASLVGAEDLELHARITRCWLGAETDVDGKLLVELYEVRRRAEELGAVGIIGRANHNLPSSLEGVGRSEEAVAAAEHGVEVCRSLGLTETEAWVHANRSLSLFSLGRWSESDAALDQAAAVAQSYKARAVIAMRRSYTLLARGDIDTAATQLALSRRLLGTEDLQPQLLVSLVHYAMEIAARQGRLADARAEFLRAHAAGLTTGPVRYSLPMLCAAAAIEAGARASGATGDTPAILAAIREAAARLHVVFPVSRAFHDLLQAEVHRAEGADDPDRWAGVVAAFEPLQRPYELAIAHLGHARALLGAHQRVNAAEQLARAREIVDRLGARLLGLDIETLTQRAGLTPTSKPAAHPPTDAVSSLGLTPRESEVLRLVAAGHSNRRIAEDLYISQKTASTHVSNILTKLGASGRTEAAAIAHRLGLLIGGRAAR